MELRPSQQAAVERVTGCPVTILHCTMGWGKTRATLAALQQLKLLGVGPAMVVAPKRVAVDQQVWQAEAAKCGVRLTFALVHGKRKPQDADVYVTSWDSLHTTAVQARLKECRVLVLDELSFAKSWGRRVKSLRGHTFDCAVGLTGTLTGGKLENLFYETLVLDGGARMGRNKTTWLNRYFTLDYNGYDWSVRDEEAVYALIEDVLFVGDAVDLPAQVVQPITVPMNTAQQTAYGELEADFIAEVASGEVVAGSLAVLSLKLRQTAAGPLIDTEREEVNWLSQERLDVVSELVSELDTPSVVFYQFRCERDELLSRIPGSASLDEPDALERWERGEVTALVAHPASAGHGLNLQHGGARHVIWMAPIWSLEMWEQANARLARPGQAHDTVFVHCLSGSAIEDKVLGALEEKRSVETALLGWAESIS